MALYELQKIDSKIDEINKVKGELPLEVQDLEDEMAGMKTRIEHINAEIEELNTLTKQRKREVDQAKIMIGNYKEQQNNVRNNREFDAITKEIEYQELEIELAEKRLKEYAAGVKAKKAPAGGGREPLRRSAPRTSRPRRPSWRASRPRPRRWWRSTPHRADARQGEDRRAAARRLRPHPPQRPQRTGRGDRQARRLRRLLQPHPAPASGGHPPGQEDHYLRVLRPHPGGRSRRNAGIGTACERRKGFRKTGSLSFVFKIFL